MYTVTQLMLNQTVLYCKVQNTANSQGGQPEMVGADHAAPPDDPPSPVQKAPTDWGFSEQQGETQVLSRRGRTLKKSLEQK